MPKSGTEPTRADLLDDLSRIYGLEPLHDDEVTVERLMAASKGRIPTRMAATRALAQAVKDGLLAPPAERMGPNGRRLKAWRRLK